MPDPTRRPGPLATVGLALLVAACPGERPEPEPAVQEEAPPPAVLPEPSAAGVWAHLEQQNYRTWQLWPGTSERYTGTEPHGMQLTTYVNGTAFQALSQGAVPLPDGSIIVKENYMPDGSYDAATVMYKRQGFAPEHADWFWAKYDAQGTAEAAGRVEMCQACHASRRDRDYLMTPVP